MNGEHTYFSDHRQKEKRGTAEGGEAEKDISALSQASSQILPTGKLWRICTTEELQQHSLLAALWLCLCGRPAGVHLALVG